MAGAADTACLSPERLSSSLAVEPKVRVLLLELHTGFNSIDVSIVGSSKGLNIPVAKANETEASAGEGGKGFVELGKSGECRIRGDGLGPFASEGVGPFDDLRLDRLLFRLFRVSIAIGSDDLDFVCVSSAGVLDGFPSIRDFVADTRLEGVEDCEDDLGLTCNVLAILDVQSASVAFDRRSCCCCANKSLDVDLVSISANELLVAEKYDDIT